jgi:GNAT superfamily N-acetyltransferase
LTDERISVTRGRIEEVQPLAAAYRADAARHGTPVEPPLPSGAVFWVARDVERQPVGYAAGQLHPERVVLGPFYVHPAHRRSGIGRRLLEEIQRWADGARIPVLEVSVAADNAAGIAFLEAAGYRPRRVLLARPEPQRPAEPR